MRGGAEVRQQVHLAQEEAERLCAEWKRTLRLEDWDIAVRIARGNGLDLSAGNQGCCSWTLSRREATVKLMAPVDYDKDCIFPQDMEATLVHELLHLHFAPFAAKEDGSPEDVAQEQAIHALSLALVALKRGER